MSGPRPSIRERLARIDSARKAPAGRGADGEPPAGAAGAVTAGRAGFLPADMRLLPVAGGPTPEGSWVRRVAFPLDHRHGRLSLREGLAADPALLALAGRCPELSGVDLRQAVFFDTETTSLSGGAGVYLFLVGLGFVEGDQFCVEQHFLRDVSEETAMLSLVRSRLCGAGAIVSFAGKSFDHPRLKDRLAMCGLHAAGASGNGDVFRREVHLDLLHPARALWRDSQPDARLATVEEHRLGFRRVDDLPGALCPVAYFDYLRGLPARLPGVFEHNVHDVLSMVVLMAELGRAMVAPADAAEALGAARLLESGGDLQAARRVLDQARARSSPAHRRRGEILRRLSLVVRKLGTRADARDLWRELATDEEHGVWALEQLALSYEHDGGDVETALGTALEAQQLLGRQAHRRNHLELERMQVGLTRRIDRLRRRLAPSPE